MPTAQYYALANITLSASAASVTFSSINQGYRDLLLVADMVHTLSAGSASMRFNGATSGYVGTTMAGRGTSAASNLSGTGAVGLTSYTDLSNTSRVICTVNIFDYSATDKHKSVIRRASKATQASELGISRYANTTAVSTILIYESSGAGSFAAGSTFVLYGVK